MKNKYIFALFIFAFMTGCSQTVTFDYDSQINIVPVDSNGHFTENCIYSRQNWNAIYTNTFKTDGSFNRFSYELETIFTWASDFSSCDTEITTNSILAHGYQGTYSYSTDNHIITYIYTDVYDTGSKSWIATNYKEEISSLFLEHSQEYPYSKSNETTWEMLNKYYYDQTKICSSSRFTYIIEISNKILSSISVDEMLNEDGSINRKYSNYTKYDIQALYSAGVAWSAGNTVTFSLKQIEECAFSYNTNTLVWELDSSNYSTNYNNKTFYHGGDYILTSFPTESTRKID